MQRMKCDHTMNTELAQAALYALPAPLALVDAGGRVVWTNAALAAALEMQTTDLPVDTTNALLISAVNPTVVAAAAAGVHDVLTGACAELSLEYVSEGPSGARWLRLDARPIAGGALLMHTDISAAKQASADVRAEALLDPVTGLPNRLLLSDRFEQALLNSSRSSGRVAVLLIDLDGFEQINVTHGTEAGDELLAEVGRRLRPTLRAGDTAARLGVDEFVVLLLGTRSADEALRVARRIVRALEAPFTLSSGIADVRASIGIAGEWSHLHTVDALLEAAALALRDAKQQGGGRVVLFDGDADP